MKPDPLVDDDGPQMTTCCPGCGSHKISFRSGKRGDEDVPPRSYRCDEPDCGARFDEPEWRPKEKNQPNHVGGLSDGAKALLEMDPDDWPPEDQELATDGGEDPVAVLMDLCRFFHLKEVGNLAKADDVGGELATAVFEIQAAAYGHAAEECWRASRYLRGELERPPAVRIGREQRSDDLEVDSELATDGGDPDWSPYRAANGAMEEVSFRAPSPMLEEIDERVENGEFRNRSEAIRRAVKDLLSRPPRVRTDGGEKNRNG